MDPQLAREYRSRWKRVAEIEAAERRLETPEQRWLKLNALLAMAIELGLDPRAAAEDDAVVWERWARLKAHLP
jgi:hypothetical protein